MLAKISFDFVLKAKRFETFSPHPNHTIEQFFSTFNSSSNFWFKPQKLDDDDFIFPFKFNCGIEWSGKIRKIQRRLNANLRTKIHLHKFPRHWISCLWWDPPFSIRPSQIDLHIMKWLFNNVSKHKKEKQATNNNRARTFSDQRWDHYHKRSEFCFHLFH